MVVGLVLAALFVLVVSIIAFVLILGSALLGVPLMSHESAEKAPVILAKVTTQVVEQQPAAPLHQAPQYVTEAAFLAAEPPEVFVYDNPAVEIALKTKNGFSFESITLIAANGKQSSFDNNTIETDSDYAAYTYVGLLPSINTHVLRYTQQANEGYVLINGENGFSTRVQGRLFKVPQSPTVIVQNKSTLQLFEQQPDGLFASRWHERFGPDPIVAIARDSNGTVLLKREHYRQYDLTASGYLFERLEPQTDKPLWAPMAEQNLTGTANDPYPQEVSSGS